MNYNTVILSGGGVKAISTLGALKYLSENMDLSTVKYWIGTSAGAVIAYLIIIGYKPLEIMTKLLDHNILAKIGKIQTTRIFLSNHLLDFDIVTKFLNVLTIEKLGKIPTFKELRDITGVELTMVTYNLTDKKLEFLNYKTRPTLSCIDAIRMTTNIPLIFKRFMYDNKEYIDGGMVNNYPTDYYIEEKHTSIGISLNMNIASESSLLGYFMSLINIASDVYVKKVPYNLKSVYIDSGLNSLSINSLLIEHDKLKTKLYSVFISGYSDMDKSLKTEVSAV